MVNDPTPCVRNLAVKTYTLSPGSRRRFLRVTLALLAVTVVVILGGAGTVVAASASGSSAPIADDSTASDTDHLVMANGTRIAPEVHNATTPTDGIVYFDSIDTETLREADDPVAKLKSHANKTQKTAVANFTADPGIEVIQTSWLANAVYIEIDPNQTDVEAIGTFAHVESIGRNYNVEPAITDTTPDPSTVNSSQQSSPTVATTTSTPTTGSTAAIGAPAVWGDTNTQGEGIQVAVLDTGIDASHPALELRTDDPTDPTVPGGWAEFDAAGQRVPGSEPYDSSNIGHGTHVSGIIAGDNASGQYIGVAPGVELMHALAIDGTSGTAIQVIVAAQWAINNEADVINLSLGAPGAQPVDIDWVRQARASGTHVVAASGNRGEGTFNSPAVVYDAYAVGASDPQQQVPDFSSGAELDTDVVWKESDIPSDWPAEYVVPDVVAPGVSVNSTVPGGEYDSFSGTSMASPHAAGAIALALSATASNQEVNRSVTNIEASLTQTAFRPDTTLTAPDTRYGHGIIDVSNAVGELLADDTPTATATFPSQTVRSNVSTVMLTEVSTEEPAVIVLAEPSSDGQARIVGDTTVGELTDASVTVPVAPLANRTGEYSVYVLSESTANDYSLGETVSTTIEEQALATASSNLSFEIIVEGRIKNASGDPLSGVTVAATKQDRTSTIQDETTTDDNGRYALIVPFGEYELVAEQDGGNITSQKLSAESFETISANLTITTTLPTIDVTGDGNPATDTTGDGRLNDINGDAEANILDVQVFFTNLEDEAIQNNPTVFDFNGDGTISILDVQALFQQLSASSG